MTDAWIWDECTMDQRGMRASGIRAGLSASDLHAAITINANGREVVMRVLTIDGGSRWYAVDQSAYNREFRVGEADRG